MFDASRTEEYPPCVKAAILLLVILAIDGPVVATILLLLRSH